MIIQPTRYRHVVDLMEQSGIGVEALVESTGVERRVVEAIGSERYTPSPDQRERVCSALGVGVQQVIWGHAAAVDPHIHQPI